MRNPTPMTLGNMRANGVRTLAVWRGGRGCDHASVLDVSRYADDLPVPAFGPRMVCAAYDAFCADAQPCRLPLVKLKSAMNGSS
jgi:hypothetical protein